MTYDITRSGSGRPAVPGEVIAVVVDTTGFDEFRDYPGALDVVLVSSFDTIRTGNDDGPDGVGAHWVLVSPAGHRVAAVCVAMYHLSIEGGRTEIHFAVGPRDRRLVELGRGWLLERASPAPLESLDALLLRSEPPLTRRNGVVLTLAVDQVLAPLLHGATHVCFVDVPDEPRAAVLRVVEDQTDGPVHTVIEVDLAHDPWLGIGGVFRLRPHTVTALRLLS